MTENVPTPSHAHLTTTGRRAQVADMLDDHLAVDAAAALTLADVLDAVSAGVLRAAGLTDEPARAVLRALWGPAGTADTSTPPYAGHRVVRADISTAVWDEWKGVMVVPSSYTQSQADAAVVDLVRERNER